MPTINRSSARESGCDRVSCTLWELGTVYYHEGYIIENDPIDVLYPRSDQVTHSGIDYICILKHTASSADEPGVGASWQTYWEISYKHYTEDEDNYYYLDPSDPILTTHPWLANKKFKGYCWKLCPFSTQFGGDGLYSVRTRSGSTVTTIFYTVPFAEQTDHTRTGGRMRFERRGSKAGWICDDLTCYHYTTNTKKFFQV